MKEIISGRKTWRRMTPSRRNGEEEESGASRREEKKKRNGIEKTSKRKRRSESGGVIRRRYQWRRQRHRHGNGMAASINGSGWRSGSGKRRRGIMRAWIIANIKQSAAASKYQREKRRRHEHRIIAA